MIAFVLGVAAVYAGLCGWGVWAEWAWLRHEPGAWLALAVQLAVAPVVAAYAAAEVLERVRPRRGFDGRVRCGRGLFVRGVAAGVLGAASGAVGLALLDRAAPDALILGGASLAASVAAVLTMSRARAGHCVLCGYDLRATPGVVCPECGSAGSRVDGASARERGESASGRARRFA